ncbi:MAG: haloacid dehalogenase-like hydrolase [Duncaniella sp.]|nr:haloacid dehalogenase-like hydrolase [Duncaniella sp.]
MGRREVAVYDFDGTLTRDDTFYTFARHALGLPRLIVRSLRAAPAIIAWKLGRITSSQAKERVYSALYRGLERREIVDASATFTPHYKKEILDRLIDSRDSGTEVWIVTASLDLWMENIARQLGVKLLCTGTSTATDGRLTGRFSTPNCRGDEKVARLRAAIPDIDNCRITVYGNEFTPGGGDAPLATIADEVVDCGR